MIRENSQKYNYINQKNYHFWKSYAIFLTKLLSTPKFIIFVSSSPLFFDCFIISFTDFYSYLYLSIKSVIC